MQQLPQRARTFVLGVIVLGGLITGSIPFLWGTAALRVDIPFLIFVGAALTTQLVGVRVVMPGQEGQAWSLVSAVLLATILLFPPANSLLLVLITFTAYWAKRRQPWYQGLFNIAQHLIAIAAAEVVWHLARGPGTAGAYVLRWYAAAFSAGLTFYLINSLLTSTVIQLVSRRPLSAIGVVSRGNFYRELVLISIGAFVAFLWLINPWQSLLLMVPLVGLSQMLKTQIEAAERIRRAQVEAEGRAQELASLNELARDLTSSLDFDQVYEAIDEQLQKSIAPQVLSVMLYDAATNQVEFHVKAGDEPLLPVITRRADAPELRALLRMRSAQVVDPRLQRPLVESVSPHGKLVTAGTVTVLPMLVAEQVMGLMMLGTEAPPTPAQLNLLSTMASQTAVALEKAQLFQRERQKSAQLSAITQVSKKIVTIHNVDVLLHQTSDLIEEAFGFARVEIVLRREGDGGDAAPAPPEAAGDIPLFYRDQTIGAMRVWLQPGAALSPDDLPMLQTLADEIAVAIENARLYEHLQMQMGMLEQTQLQLLQSAKLATIGELAAFIAHEINNPLTSVLGYASLILSETPAEDPKRADIEVIEKEALRARSIVRDLLGYARQTDSAMEETHLNEAIESIFPLIRRRAESTNVAIDAQLDPRLPEIIADVNQLKQVFINILNNAIDAMPQGGTIRVETRQVAANGTGPLVEISFRDSGVGIDADHLARIFDPFFTTKGAGKGTGLGLPISKRIVERHGGTIEVSSEKGHGTRFTIHLPVADPF